MGYDLLNVPDGYKTDLALIIAPYFDLQFAEQLIKTMKPRRLRFLLDDGASKDDVHRLREKCGTRKVKIALGGAAGIVHIKGFYLEFVKSSGRARRKRRFIFGSANATEAAFGEQMNAELIAYVDLSAGQDQELLDYLMAVLEAVENETGHIANVDTPPLRNSPRLRLPSFKVSAIGPAPGFDTWLQRGRLAAKYREAQQFMTVAVTLRKQLPQGVVATTFARRGLIQQGARNVVRYPYVGDTFIEEDDDEHIPNWKARFSVWTQFGDWVSEECFQSHHSSMHSNSAPRKEARLAELLEHKQDSQWERQHRASFVNTIQTVWDDLLAAKESPSDYLEGNPSGIDSAYYNERFKKKFAADLLLASDDDFCARYVSGYDFPKVPKFRQDAPAWEAFVQSWCQSVAVEASRSNSQSLLMRTVKAVFEEKGETLALFEANEIGKKLRGVWSKSGAIVSSYFEQ